MNKRSIQRNMKIWLVNTYQCYYLQKKPKDTKEIIDEDRIVEYFTGNNN